MGNEFKESIKDCLDWIWFEGAKAAKGEKHKSISKVVDETADRILSLVKEAGWKSPEERRKSELIWQEQIDRARDGYVKLDEMH